MAPYINELSDQPYGDWRDEFFEKGYIVLKGVIPQDRVIDYRTKMLNWLGDFPNDFDINDRTTWTSENLPQSFNNGTYLNYCAAHERYVWDARQEPGVLAAFEKLWGTNELIVSYDGINITLPNAGNMRGTSKSSPHVDQAPSRPGLSCVQGIINLSESGPKDGGLVVLEGSSRLFSQFFKSRPPDPSIPKHPPPLSSPHYDFYPFTPTDLSWFTSRGCSPIEVCASPGDLILWDSRTIHYSVHPESDTIRTAINACYAPANMASKKDLQRKKEIFGKWEATAHWPHINVHSMGKAKVKGEVDGWERREPLERPVLSEGLLKLAGVLPY